MVFSSDPPGPGLGTSSGLVFPDPFDYLTANAVRHMLRFQDVDRFLDWMRQEAPKLHPGVFSRVPDAVLWPSFATSLGTGLWNAMPLPRNEFRPEPLPAMRPGDLCRCQSGLPFDDCCALFPPPPPFKAEALWTFVAEQLPLENLEEQVLIGHLPGRVLGVVAMRLIERGAARRAARILESVFAAPQDLGAEYEVALDALFDAYDALHWRGKKRRSLVRLCDVLTPPLRGVVWARRSTIAADEGKTEQAWEFFTNAQQDDPDNPSLAGLEVTLLLSQGSTEQAAARAEFWLTRLRRRSDGGTFERLEQLLEGVIDDPLIAVWEFSHEVEPDHLHRVRDLFATLDDRPLPEVKLLEHHGLSELVGSTDLIDVLRGWHDVWHDGPMMHHPGEAVLWEPEVAEAWIDFLEEEPRAFDCLQVLDDLQVISRFLEYPLPIEAQRAFLRPLVKRGGAIIEAALSGSPAADPPRLPWGILGNRPTLRLLHGLATHLDTVGEQDEAEARLEGILALNPDDNQGIRFLLVNRYLLAGHDDKALALCEAYDEDTSTDLLYGRVLALYRLGRIDEALAAFDIATRFRPNIWVYLTGQKRRRPSDDGLPFVVEGSDEEAFEYRAEMLSAWKSVRGLMARLRKHQKGKKT